MKSMSLNRAHCSTTVMLFNSAKKPDPYRYHKLFVKDFVIKDSNISIKDLPNEILDMIFMELGIYNIFARVVCKQWYSIVRFNEKHIDTQARDLLNYGDFHCLKYIALNGYLLPTSDTWCKNLSTKLGQTGSLSDFVWFKDYGYEIIPFNFTCGLVKRGDISMLEFAKSKDLLDKQNKIYSFATHGNLEVFKWIHKEKIQRSREVCEVAAENGHLHVLQWAKENGYKWNPNICAYAAKSGHIDILIWARDHGCPWDENTCIGAAIGGHLDILILARKNDCPWDESVYSAAAKHGHLNIIEWALQNGGPRLNYKLFNFAAINGHLNVIQWAHERGHRFPKQMCNDAAAGGHLHILKWAMENGYEFDESICYFASNSGHLDIVQWARKNDLPWNHYVCINAAQNGFLHVIKWAIDNGALWHKRICDEAARNGHLSVLRWAIENGCAYDDSVWKVAAENNHFRILKFAIEKGYLSKTKSDHYTKFHENLNSHILKTKYPSVMKYAVKHHLIYLTDQICWDAVKYGHIEILEYAKKYGHKWRADKLLCDLAIQKGRPDIFKWLIKNGYQITKSEYNLIESKLDPELYKWFNKQNIPWNTFMNRMYRGFKKMIVDIIYFIVKTIFYAIIYAIYYTVLILWRIVQLIIKNL